MYVILQGKDAKEEQVIINSTVYEKNVTYPTNGKLAIKMRPHLHRIEKEEDVQVNR